MATLPNLNSLADAPTDQCEGPLVSASIVPLRDGRAPARAARVHLIGPMSGVGFAEQQWLVERDGEYIQLTDLLYRVVEQADGHRTVDEIADAVSSATEWTVSGQDVDQLISSKLMPLGLFEGYSQEPSPAGSALDLNIRCTTISPRFITPITRCLQYLCAPVLVSVVLAVSIAGNFWLYRYHGIGVGLQDALNTPGGLLLTIVLVLAGAVFHEFGHASALRYHGGNVGGMGVGVYLVYPVFYTDVTDGYRLNRRARLGIDLGGIYFHLVFVACLFVAYFWNHRELFLLSVVLVDLEIIRQFIPLVRLDGYWAMTDLTGVPDLFSQTIPFLKTLFPSAGIQGDALPTLKKWVAVVYITYLVVVFPILGYLLLMMVLNFPELVSTTWAALHNQFNSLMAIGVVKNPGATLLVTLQIVLLLVPIVGTVYLCWIIIKGPLRNFVDWTGRTRRNAAIGLASAAGVCGVAAAVVILPAATLFHRARLHEPAIITDAQRALHDAHSLSADVEGSLGSDHFKGTVVLQKPNLARIQIDGSGSLGRFLIVSDGKKLTTYFQDDNEYVEASPGSHGEQIDAFVAEQVADFFQPELLLKRPHSRSINHINLDGEPQEVVTYESPTQSLRYYVSSKDKLIHRIIRGKDQNQPTAFSTMSNIRINRPIAATAFTWKLPATARPAQAPGGFAVPLQR